MKTGIMNTTGRLLSVVVMVTLFGTACSSSDKTETKQQQPIEVEVQTADYAQSSATHYYSGTVSSDHTINLSTKVLGRIIELDLEEGDYFKKGEVLVRIQDDNLQAQKNQVEAGLIEARAALKNTETNYNRIKALYEQESATKKELDDISTRYEMAKAKVKTLESKLQEVKDLLDYTVLKAPFNGYVISKMVSQGDMSGPGQPILTIEQEGMMKVNVTVPESQVSLLNLNDTVWVDVQAVGYEKGIGIVKNINQAGNRGSRQFAVEIALPELKKKSGVKSGMFAEVGLATEKDLSIFVPKSSIVERGQLTGLYTLNDESEVVLRWVRLGEKNGDRVEVLSGLTAGEMYVSRVDQPLPEGQKIITQQ